MAVHANFSKDYSKLLYLASEEKFLSHSGTYQLKYLKWPPGDEP